MEDSIRPAHNTREAARCRAESEKQGDHCLRPAESGRAGVFCAGNLLSRRLFAGEHVSAGCGPLHSWDNPTVPDLERLDRLRFDDAMNDCIALSELAMDMVEAFSSRRELVWIQNGFTPTIGTHFGKSRRPSKTSAPPGRRRAQ